MNNVWRVFYILCLVHLLNGFCFGQRKNSTLLPPSEAINLTKQCSRPAPSEVSGIWQPLEDDIKVMESKFSQISELKAECCLRGSQIKDPDSYYMQYVGIIVKGKKYIYINAFSEERASLRWKEQPVMVCDGGSGFWGVMYEMESGKFVELAVNGEA